MSGSIKATLIDRWDPCKQWQQDGYNQGEPTLLCPSYGWASLPSSVTSPPISNVMRSPSKRIRNLW